VDIEHPWTSVRIDIIGYHTRRAVWLRSRSALSKTFIVLDGAILGVLGTVACAAAPNAALSGVAGTGVTYPPEPEPRLLVEYGWEKAEATEVIAVLIGLGKDGAPVVVIVGLFKNFGVIKLLSSPS
jgi:hypothetical protein